VASLWECWLQSAGRSTRSVESPWTALQVRRHSSTVGFTEFVFGWPSTHQMSAFEHFVEEVMLRLLTLPARPPAP
jgi:hypothetical protein